MGGIPKPSYPEKYTSALTLATKRRNSFSGRREWRFQFGNCGKTQSAGRLPTQSICPAKEVFLCHSSRNLTARSGRLCGQRLVKASTRFSFSTLSRGGGRKPIPTASTN